MLRPVVLSALVSTVALCLLVGAGCTPQPTLDLRPGARLLYEVDYLGLDRYPFIVTVVQNDSVVALDYLLDHPPSSSQGRITMTPSALDDGFRQMNFYADGRHDYTFEDSTTVWVSDAVYEAMAAGRPVMVNLGPSTAPDDTMRTTGREMISVRIGDETVELPVLVGRTDDGKGIWVWDNPENPVILKLYQRWYLTIRAFEPPPGGE